MTDKQLKDFGRAQLPKKRKPPFELQGKLHLREDLWELIKDGTKKYEFRKLEKGLITGWYDIVDIVGEPLGYMFIKPIAVNPIIIDTFKNIRELLKFSDEIIYSFTINMDTKIVDKHTYKFLKDNYIGQYDFMAYEILEWRGKNGKK